MEPLIDREEQYLAVGRKFWREIHLQASSQAGGFENTALPLV